MSGAPTGAVIQVHDQSSADESRCARTCWLSCARPRKLLSGAVQGRGRSGLSSPATSRRTGVRRAVGRLDAAAWRDGSSTRLCRLPAAGPRRVLTRLPDRGPSPSSEPILLRLGCRSWPDPTALSGPPRTSMTTPGWPWSLGRVGAGPGDRPGRCFGSGWRWAAAGPPEDRSARRPRAGGCPRRPRPRCPGDCCHRTVPWAGLFETRCARWDASTAGEQRGIFGLRRRGG